jgi:dihydrofolate synthase/folylpolyglutamate synthase
LAKDEGDKVLFCPTAHEILLCVALLAFCAHKCNICIIESDHNGEDPSRFLPAPFAAVICGSIPNENRDRQDIYKIRSYICRGVREIISAPQNTEAYKIIADTCSAVNCRLTIAAKNKIEINRLTLRGTDFSYKGSEYSLRICGKFQTVNALVAIESAEMLVRLGYAISKEQICEGLAEVSAPCKFEILSISPTIIADSTHTPIAIEAVCDSLADFKDITGTKIKLCLPDGELIPYYIEALTRRGYEISAISALAIESIGEEERGNPNIPLVLSKTIKATAKSALLELDHDTTLLISGPSNFTRALRYELLCILGF